MLQKWIALVGVTLLVIAGGAHATEWEKVKQAGVLKVGVYNANAPFSDKGAGADVDLAGALAAKLGLKLALLPFDAGENMNDDLRNMVWRGHYLGYGPADVLLHVPVERALQADNDKVSIFGPYLHEKVVFGYDKRKLNQFESLADLGTGKIAAEKGSLGAIVVAGAENGKYVAQLTNADSAVDAAGDLKAGRAVAWIGLRSEIESLLALPNDQFGLKEMWLPGIPRQGWAIGMAVKSQSKELQRELMQALDALQTSGELARILAKHGIRSGR